MHTVRDRVRQVLNQVPRGVTVVAAAKGATAEDVREAIDAGITVVAHNYFAEARRQRAQLTLPVEWHFIGRLRPHDVRPANLSLFDALQSLDSLATAQRISDRCSRTHHVMPVFLEVNIAREPQKGGVYPDSVEETLQHLASLSHVRVVGLMTMGPLTETPEDVRPFFAEMRQLYNHVRRMGIPGLSLEHLSMGMSNSYEVAIEEGATMVRLGTRLFGPR